MPSRQTAADAALHNLIKSLPQPRHAKGQPLPISRGSDGEEAQVSPQALLLGTTAAQAVSRLAEAGLYSGCAKGAAENFC